jgi:hypothetical protein
MTDSTAISDHVPRRVLTPTRCRVARASSRSRSEDRPDEGVGAKRMRSRARTVARRACLPSVPFQGVGGGPDPLSDLHGDRSGQPLEVCTGLGVNRTDNTREASNA